MKRLTAGAWIMVLSVAATSQPWPWPTENQSTVYPVNNNYGEYQEFGDDIYCHSGVDIVIPSGSGIYAVLDTGFVALINRPDSSMARCTDEQYFTAVAEAQKMVREWAPRAGGHSPVIFEHEIVRTFWPVGELKKTGTLAARSCELEEFGLDVRVV